MKRLTSGLFVTMLAVGMLALAFNVKPAASAPATIVVPDDYPTIQAAINAASPGDTVRVKAGTYHENVAVGKALSLVGENLQNTIVDGSGVGNVVNITTNDVNVTGFTVRNSSSSSGVYAGIYLDHASNCSITGNNITDNGLGIYLYVSANDTVSKNNIARNNDDGVWLEFALDNTVSENNITANNNDGVYLYSSSNNTVSGNSITDNGSGVDLYGSSNNTVSENNIKNNGNGIYLYGSSGNGFFHNNFIGNLQQVSSSQSANIWDNGYPSGGNYWSNYEARYPNATEADSSGIWNTPYVIDANNADHYPTIPEFSTPMILFWCILAWSVAFAAVRRKRTVKTTVKKTPST